MTTTYNTNITNKINDDFCLSDNSGSDTDSEFKFDNSNDDDIKFLNTLHLEDYPQPYNTLGQLIMSAMTGITISYILNKKIDKEFNVDIYVKKYFDYLKTVEKDQYVNDILLKLEIDRDNIEDNIKFNIILDKTQQLTIDLLNELLDKNNLKYSSYFQESENDFNIGDLESKLLEDITQILIFDRLKKLV